MERRLPPGPNGLPLLGNALRIPTQTVILIGDLRTAKELLEKHSSKHSSRPMLPYFVSDRVTNPTEQVNECFELQRKHIDPENILWAFSEECESHSLGRKLTAAVMSLVRRGKTERLQEYEAALNIQHLLDDDGKDWFRHIKRYIFLYSCDSTETDVDCIILDRVAASTTLTLLFGLNCPTGCEPELQTFYDLFAEEACLLTPTASITNIFPFLDLIPGPMSWRTRAQSYRSQSNTLSGVVNNRMVISSLLYRWAAFFAKADKHGGDQSRLIRQFTPAAIETTTISLHTFVLACIRYPDWIAMAQREIDNIVGLDRMPTFKDRPFLPYVEAIVRGVPLGVKLSDGVLQA
ncbi:hypothetical protein C0992_003585 [Termitomyces sp. T32_za158]|nr:hypothetical protein C0992_003585 [Termitomyces sp. T32_za158]